MAQNANLSIFVDDVQVDLCDPAHDEVGSARWTEQTANDRDRRSACHLRAGRRRPKQNRAGGAPARDRQVQEGASPEALDRDVICEWHDVFSRLIGYLDRNGDDVTMGT